MLLSIPDEPKEVSFASYLHEVDHYLKETSPGPMFNY